MATMNGLTKRIDALEQAVGLLRRLPCVGCSKPHVSEALSSARISARYLGSDEPLPASCECACCRPFLDDLEARFARHLERVL